MPDDDPPETPLSLALILDGCCPRCLGELDEGWRCNRCGYDAIVTCDEDDDVREA